MTQEPAAMSRLRRFLTALITSAALAAAMLLPATAASAATSVAPASQSLAQQIIASGRLVGTGEAYAQVQAYANGSMRSHVIGGVVRDCQIDPVILNALKVVTVDRGFTLRVTSINRYCVNQLTASGTSSYHWRNGGGHAIDFDQVNGVPATGSSSQDLALIRSMFTALPAPAGLGQLNCHGFLDVPSGWVQFDDACNHNHFEYRGNAAPPSPGVPITAADGPASIIDTADRISLYAIRTDGNLWGASQGVAGAGLSAWQKLGGDIGSLSGRPAVLRLSSGVLAIYARTTAGTIVGTNQVSPGGAFTPWTTIGANGGGIVGDPAAVQFQHGGIGIYATTDAGTVAGVAQASAGAAFGSWTTIGSSSVGLIGTPALVLQADDRLSVFARTADARVFSSSQTGVGSIFAAWSEVGTGGAGVSADPIAVDDSGRVTLFAGAGSTVASVTQMPAGGAFGAWVNLGSGPSPIGASTPSALISGGSYSAYSLGADGNVWGTTVSTTPAPAGWAQIGSGATITTAVTSVRTSAGVNCVYGVTVAGVVAGTCQSAPGGAFGSWATM